MDYKNMRRMRMAEYIDRCTLPVKQISFGGPMQPRWISVVYADDIASEPSADVAPVVHGKWLDEDFPENMATVHGMAICSACGKLSHKAEHGYNILSKYCPHCGAKMDL